MHIFRSKKLASCISLALTSSALYLTAPVFAQSTEGVAQTDMEDLEIISISRKRPESLQEVPIAVTALSKKDIEAAGIQRPSDFINLIPNVSIVDTANVGDTQVSIRGIVSTRDAESTFAYVVDGVLITNPNAFNGELLDVAQIEVLKGPQGALYGRNAVSGAILITTNEPSDFLEGSVSGGVGNNNTNKINGVISGPLSENVSARLTVSHSNTDGHYSNSFTGADNSVDFLKDTSAKARLIWRASDTLKLDFRAGYSEVEGGAINYNAVFALPSFETAFVQPAYFADVNKHEFNFTPNVPGENKQKTKDLALKADWDLDGFDVTAVLSYNDLEEYLLSDGTSASFYGYELTSQCQTDRVTLNNTPAALGGANRTDLFGEFFAPFGVFPPGIEFTGVYGPYTPTACDGYQYQNRSQSDYSGELRLTSDNSSDPYRWIAGLYFTEIERDVVVAYGADLGQGFLRQPYVPADGPNPTDLLFDDTFNTSVMSAFGQVEYDLTEQLELSVAMRYDYEDRDVSNNVPNVSASGLNVNTYVNGVLGPINPAFNVTPDGIPDRNKSFSQLQPKVTLAYDANEFMNWYLSYGVGFRSGGFNSIGTQATLDFWFNRSGTGTPGDVVNAQINVTDDYNKEVTTNTELGFKSTFLDKRIKLNAAVFKTEVEDNQFFEFFAGPFGLLRAVTTIDKLSIQGIEFDFQAKVTDDIKLYGGLGLLDSEIKENRNRPMTVGNKAPQAPEESAALGIMWDYEVTSDIVMTSRVDWQYVGKTYFHTLQGEQTPTIWDFFGTLGGGVPPGPHPQDFSNSIRDAYSTVNARISFAAETWKVALWMNNLTNENYLQEIINAPEFGGSFIHPSARKSYGIDFTYNF